MLIHIKVEQPARGYCINRFSAFEIMNFLASARELRQLMQQPIFHTAVRRVIELKRPTIYLIDADQSVLDEMRKLLASLNVEIEQFFSAESFLQMERPEEFACLVANVALPGLSGLALIEKLQENDVHLPTVLIDDRGDVSTAVRAMRAGVFDYIEKPFTDRLLLKAVSDAISACIEKDPADPSIKH